MTPEEEARKLAEYRFAHYKGDNDTNYMGPPLEVLFLGYLGEVLFARCFGFPRDTVPHIGSDGGVDYRFTVAGEEYTVNVKMASSRYGLMVKPKRRPADIFVLLNYIDGKHEFIGWEYGDVMINAVLKDFGHGEGHHKPIHQLQPIRTLCDLLARRDL